MFQVLDEVDGTKFEDGGYYGICDRCEEELALPLWTSLGVKSEWERVDFCVPCWQKEDTIREIFSFESIDRRGVSTDEKPLIWPCVYCHEKMGGGHLWHTARVVGPVANQSVLPLIWDICVRCWESEGFELDEMKNGLRKLFKFIPSTGWVICQRTSPGIYLDITDCAEQRDLEVLPPQIREEITKDRVEAWVDVLDSLVEVTAGTEFGSMKRWTLFTDFYEIPHFNAATALAVDCHKEGRGRVASVVADDHGRCAVNVVYETSKDYLEQLEQWQLQKLEEGSDVFKAVDQHVSDSFEDKGECDNALIAKLCTEFSGYCRLMKDLDFYYG